MNPLIVADLTAIAREAIAGGARKRTASDAASDGDDGDRPPKKRTALPGWTPINRRDYGDWIQASGDDDGDGEVTDDHNDEWEDVSDDESPNGKGTDDDSANGADTDDDQRPSSPDVLDTEMQDQSESLDNDDGTDDEGVSSATGQSNDGVLVQFTGQSILDFYRSQGYIPHDAAPAPNSIRMPPFLALAPRRELRHNPQSTSKPWGNDGKRNQTCRWYALFIQVGGRVADEPCYKCSRVGRWTPCVVAPTEDTRRITNGACACCLYHPSDKVMCTFYRSHEPVQSTTTQNATSSVLDASAPEKTPTGDNERVEETGAATQLDDLSQQESTAQLAPLLRTTQRARTVRLPSIREAIHQSATPYTDQAGYRTLLPSPARTAPVFQPNPVSRPSPVSHTAQISQPASFAYMNQTSASAGPSAYNLPGPSIYPTGARGIAPSGPQIFLNPDQEMATLVRQLQENANRVANIDLQQHQFDQQKHDLLTHRRSMLLRLRSIQREAQLPLFEF